MEETLYIISSDPSIWEGAVPNWISSIATLIGVIGLFLAYRQFIKQKWWEKKAEFYTDIIKHIYNTKLHAQQVFEAEINEQTLSEEKNEELKKIFNESKEKIDMYIDIGMFVVSRKVLKRLLSFRQELNRSDQTNDWYDYLNNEIEASNRCTEDIIKLAKKDLKVKIKDK